MPVWGGGVDTLATLGAAPQTGQVGFGTGFVNKDQPGRVQRRLLPTPMTACPGYIRPVLLTGPERLFLYVSPMLANT